MNKFTKEDRQKLITLILQNIPRKPNFCSISELENKLKGFMNFSRNTLVKYLDNLTIERKIVMIKKNLMKFYHINPYEKKGNKNKVEIKEEEYNELFFS